jgi:hypothetical protein
MTVPCAALARTMLFLKLGAKSTHFICTIALPSGNLFGSPKTAVRATDIRFRTRKEIIESFSLGFERLGRKSVPSAIDSSIQINPHKLNPQGYRGLRLDPFRPNRCSTPARGLQIAQVERLPVHGVQMKSMRKM